MQVWRCNGASRQVKSCEIPFVLSGTPLSRPGSDQIAAKPVTVGNHGPRKLPAPLSLQVTEHRIRHPLQPPKPASRPASSASRTPP